MVAVAVISGLASLHAVTHRNVGGYRWWTGKELPWIFLELVSIKIVYSEGQN